MHPFTFVASTYNLWGTCDWPQRRRPLERFLELQRPDVSCAQELSPETCDRGPIRPTVTSVVDFHVRQIAPSDHKPVVTSYELIDEASP